MAGGNPAQRKSHRSNYYRLHVESSVPHTHSDGAVSVFQCVLVVEIDAASSLKSIRLSESSTRVPSLAIVAGAKPISDQPSFQPWLSPRWYHPKPKTVSLEAHSG